VHHFVAVLVRKSARGNIEEEVSRLFAPYDEQLEVQEYERECSCVGFAAYRRAYAEMRNRFGTIETRDALEFGKTIFDSDPEKSRPRADCEVCHGIGKWKSRCNPNGKWDWWSFGGRWDGAIRGDFSKTNPYAISHAHDLEGNIAAPRFLIEHDIIPSAIVTPDGVWHEQEEWRGWEWAETARSILSKNTEALAVGVDCHA
jgi:hypothetical protein